MPHLTRSSRRRCPVCGQLHRDVVALAGPWAPDDWLRVGPGERLEAELTPDICILPCDGTTRYFVRGHLCLPVDEWGFGDFTWSVWVELDELAMQTVARTWTDRGRDKLPPLFGRLANELPYEQPTKGLAVDLHTRAVGQVPLIALSAGCEHRLAREQSDGIDVHRAAELAGLMSPAG